MTKSVKNFLNMIARMGEPHYESSTEEDFCRNWVFLRWYSMVTTGFVVAVAANIVTLSTFHLYAHPQVINVFYALHLSYLGLLIGSLVFKNDKKMFMHAISVSTVLFVFAYNYGVYRVLELNDFQRFLHVCLGLVAIASFTVQVLPLTSWLGLSSSLSYVLGIYLATYNQPRAVVVTGIFGIVVGLSFLMRQRIFVTAIGEAKREYALRSQIAPAHIVRKTMSDSRPISELFAPELKFCVCISSDWRSYQQMSQKMSNQALSLALSRYYDLCEAILENVAPLGNFYSDWIADELFVVMYQSEADTQQSLVRSAIRFTDKLVRAKQDFHKEYGLPEAIDVGVACGQSLIGMMGPKTFKKATALGVIPGRARRYQQIGKQIRRTSFNTDRIIFDEKVKDLINPDDYQIFSIEASTVVGVKDIYESKYYYLEPAMRDKPQENPDQTKPKIIFAA